MKCKERKFKMLKSNSKKVIEKIHKYIIDGVNHEYFGIEADPDYKTACKMILTACMNEKNMTVINLDFVTFKDWMQGLPTAFNSTYYYNISAIDILGEWLEETDEEKIKYDENKAEEMITRLIYRELMKGVSKA